MSSVATSGLTDHIDTAHAPTASAGLHSLPMEVIERILIYSDPRDVSRYSRTCTLGHNLVYSQQDQYLWRALYLGRPYDDLRQAVTKPHDHFANPTISEAQDSRERNVLWRSELQRRTQAELIAACGTRDATLLETAYSAFLSAIDTALPVEANEGTPKNTEGDESPSRSENLRWLDRLLRRTRVLDIVPTYTGAIVNIPSLEQLNPNADNNPFLDRPSGASALHSSRDRSQPENDAPDVCWLPRKFQAANQMRARLRAYVALSHENSYDATSRDRMAKLRRASRAFVYDMRKYQPSTLWGPYRIAEDGRTVLVNWEHVEHIMNAVGLKLRDIPIASLGYYKKPPFKIDSLRAYSAVGAFERPQGDWAGVTGTWRRFVCFMDYRDLYMFNYSNHPPGPHSPSFFDDQFEEALRPVELVLSLISREEYFSEPHRIALDPSTDAARSSSRGGPIGDCEDPAFPTLYFKGYSSGVVHMAAATIRGKVSTLSDGAVRWQFVTTYDGRMQWSAEAVQLGHVCSAAGMAGIWTGAHHDRDDPAGPFWMVKVNDNLPQGILNTLH